MLRVELISTRHGIQRHNPVRGSSHACLGTVKKIRNYQTEETHRDPTVSQWKALPAKQVGPLPVEVIWDNGESNVYSKRDLMLACGKGHCKSIWDK